MSTRENTIVLLDSRLDAPVARVHRFLFVRHRGASFTAAVAVYVGVVLAFGHRLGISSNYFVILPILVAALCRGTAAGLLAGLLGLPANLLLFAVLGRPEFSPESKPIAEASGVVVGFAFGYLADYFQSLETEIMRRRASERRLRESAEEKALLLRELSHRVKNNLNVILSLARMQRHRSKDPVFVEASRELESRIFAIALVHDQLYGSPERPFAEATAYMESLARNIARSYGHPADMAVVEVGEGFGELSSDQAIPLGLIVNEALANACKHAGADGEPPRVRIRLEEDGDERVLAVSDDGPGVSAGDQEGPGLGTKIVRALAGQLGGTVSISGPEAPRGERDLPGALLELRWPRLPARRTDPVY